MAIILTAIVVVVVAAFIGLVICHHIGKHEESKFYSARFIYYSLTGRVVYWEDEHGRRTEEMVVGDVCCYVGKDEDVWLRSPDKKHRIILRERDAIELIEKGRTGKYRLMEGKV